MKRLIFFLLSVYFLNNVSAQSSGEKIALKLDSICKAEKIEKIAIYFHTVGALVSQILEERCGAYKFQEQFLIMSDFKKNPIYYNLDKVIHFTVDRKELTLKLFLAY